MLSGPRGRCANYEPAGVDEFVVLAGVAGVAAAAGAEDSAAAGLLSAVDSALLPDELLDA